MGRRILVVEDDEDLRTALRLLLEAKGHTVQEAGNGVRGIFDAIAWRPDVICLDLKLPALDGFDVARQIRAAIDPMFRPLVIAITGLADEQSRLRARALGIDAYLTKPFDADVLDGLITDPPV